MQSQVLTYTPAIDVHGEMQAFTASFGNQRVSLEDLEVETAINAFCQRERFPSQFAALYSGKPEVPKSSSIFKPKSVFYIKGVLTVGGLLNKAAVIEDIPSICPRTSTFPALFSAISTTAWP